jgi:hypothetical protein
MTLRFAVTATLLAIAVVSPRAQTQPMPKGQMPDLGRPTRPGDVAPPLNFAEYFVGTWAFEWDVPEGPLGPSGRISGTTTYKKVDEQSFAADTEATGPAGPLTIHEAIQYDREQKMLTREVRDSRGFSYRESAPVSGDAGGIYYIYLESSPFTYAGHTIRLKHNLRLLSPLNYRVAISVSENSGPFVNYGNPWFRKQHTVLRF